MKASHFIRQFHRWVSIAFTLAVIANFVAMALGHGAQPPPWITFSPLLPLALLLFTGLYMFVLPYVGSPTEKRTPRSAKSGGPREHMVSS